MTSSRDVNVFIDSAVSSADLTKPIMLCVSTVIQRVLFEGAQRGMADTAAGRKFVSEFTLVVFSRHRVTASNLVH